MKPERTLDVGFCPFCRESYENLARCPAHDLPLVTFAELSPDEDAEPSPLSPIGGGRWIVIVAVATTLAGFLMPVVAIDGTSTTGMLLAAEQAPNVWIVPACAFAALAIIARRKTLHELASARFAVFFLGLVVLVSMFWTARAILRGAAERGAIVEAEIGAWLVAAAVLAYFASPFILGVERTRRQVESGR